MTKTLSSIKKRPIKTRLAASLFGLAVLCTPFFAFALSPVTDNFDASLAGWSGVYTRTVFTHTSTGCFVGGCAFAPAGGATLYGMQEQGTSVVSGSYVIYFKHVPHSTPSGDSIFFISLCDGATCETSTHAADLDFTDMGEATNYAHDDSLYHSLFIGWRDGVTNKEYCHLVDDTNSADCTWSTDGLTIPNGTAFETLGFWLQSLMNTDESFYLDELGNTSYSNDTTTRIDTVTPVNGSTIATSSAATFEFTGYVNSADYASGTTLEVKYARYSSSQSATANPDNLFTTLTFPINSSGAFDLSTTSPVLGGGEYTMQTQIVEPSLLNNVLNFFGFGLFANNGVKTATSSTFIAAQLNQFDVFVASTTQSVNNYLASSTVSLASCTSWTSFSLGDCLNLLFVPQTQPIADALGNFKNNFLSYFPWGYVTRTISILSGGATSTLPTFSVTYPLGSATDLDTYTMDMNDTITGGATLLNSITERGGTGNLQTIVEPWVQLFIALFVVLHIVRDVSGMGAHPQAHNFHHRRGQV